MPLPEEESAYEAVTELERRRTERDLPGWFDKSVKPWFSIMFDTVWSGFTEHALNALKRAWNDIAGSPIKIKWQDWANLTKHAVEAGMMDKDTAKEVEKLKDLPFPVDLFMYLTVWLKYIGDYMTVSAYGASAEVRHNLASRYTPEIPDAGTLAAAAFIAPEKTQEIRDGMKKAGFSDEYINLIFLSRYRLYDENMVRELYWRGVLSKDEMYMRMRELGYTDTRINELEQAWTIIPGPADLFHLVAKEAFEPDMIAKMGLDDEFPASQVEWLKKQGVSEDWARKYWYAHWEQPSIQQGFEMLHRGVIDWDTLDMLFRTVEIPPFWRDKLTKIAFMPLTRVDSRRMHDLGVLTDEELIGVYKDQGYNDVNARRMADFTVRYNREHDRDLTKSEILTGYKERLMSKDEAYQYLKEMEYDFREADYLLTKVDYDETKKVRDMHVKNIGDRFKNNLTDEFDTRSKLNSLDLAANYTDALITEWKIDKFEDMKVPSKTDLDKFLKAKIIDTDRYMDEMRKLGYSDEYAGFYLRLAKGK